MTSEAALSEAFNVFDSTGKGVLGWNDCKDAVRTLGTPFSEEQFNAVKPGDKIDFAAFKAMYQKLKASAPASNVDEDLKAAFGAMDGAKKGKVTKVMVRHFLTSVGDKFSDAEADAMLKDAPAELDLAAFRVVILGK